MSEMNQQPVQTQQPMQQDAAYTQAPVQVVNQSMQIQASTKTVNKHVFVWVFNFLLGGLGVDRFVRGQVGLGILKLLFNWATLGLWSLIDWIISITKAYGSAFSDTEDLIFVNGKYAR